jgi:uncharacterized DUF497 family protein
MRVNGVRIALEIWPTDRLRTIQDPSLAYFADLDQPDRFIAIGYSALARILVVVHLEMGDTIRIISARKASRHERKFYPTERS